MLAGGGLAGRDTIQIRLGGLLRLAPLCFLDAVVVVVFSDPVCRAGKSRDLRFCDFFYFEAIPTQQSGNFKSWPSNGRMPTSNFKSWTSHANSRRVHVIKV